MSAGLELIGLLFCYLNDADLDAVKSHTHRLKAVDCRCEISKFAVALGYSRSEIGRWMGGRDHSTITHQLRLGT